jgi:transposase
MWTEEHRRIYRREGDGYPSDLRDAEWARLKPIIPPARTGGRPRKTDMRAAMNAILYLPRNGCPWSYLPRKAFLYARRSTTSSAISSVMACGKRSGPSCTSPYANGWAGRTARRRRFSTASRSNQPKKGR